MCVTVGETTLNEFVHIMFWTQNHGRVYTSVKITLYPQHHWSPLKTVKLPSLIVLREVWAYTYYLV